MEFNEDKFKAVLLYIINRCENKSNVGKTLICKLLYFSDFNYYEIYEESITNETYLKFERGPYPDHIDDVLNKMIENKEVIFKKEPYYNGTTIHKYYLTNVPDLSLLNTKELSVINNVIDKISDFSANEASNYSHGDMPWMIAEDNEELDYEYVFYRDPEYSVRKYDN
ncbi:MAG: SocA family protein [Methanobrevibacter sp.]|nr:SocA family protein [Methanobrevibacter sp.]